MSLTQITDHADRARSRLARQLRGTVFHGAVLDALSGQVQEVEGALWDLLSVYVIEQSSGAQLERIGAIVGASLAGLSDVDYRSTIRAQIAVNRGSGSPPEVLTILRDILDAYAYDGTNVQYLPLANAEFEVLLNGLTAQGYQLSRRLAVVLNKARIAGVASQLRYLVAEASASLRFEPPGSETLSPATTLASPCSPGDTTLHPGSVLGFGVAPFFILVGRGTEGRETMRVSSVNIIACTFTVDAANLHHDAAVAVEKLTNQGLATCPDDQDQLSADANAGDHYLHVVGNPKTIWPPTGYLQVVDGANTEERVFTFASVPDNQIGLPLALSHDHAAGTIVRCGTPHTWPGGYLAGALR
jgi:hypothetical protein